MLQIQFERGYSVPILVCAQCGEALHDAAVAAVVYNAAPPDGQRVTPLYVHKGRIGRKTCHEEVDKQIEANGGIPAWQEMRQHLISLVNNSGVTTEDFLADERRNPRE